MAPIFPQITRQLEPAAWSHPVQVSFCGLPLLQYPRSDPRGCTQLVPPSRTSYDQTSFILRPFCGTLSQGRVSARSIKESLRIKRHLLPPNFLWPPLHRSLDLLLWLGTYRARRATRRPKVSSRFTWCVCASMICASQCLPPHHQNLYNLLKHEINARSVSWSAEETER